MKTQIGIIGAGPAGLMLGHLLHLLGIDSVILERKSREYIENRIRAGVLEHPVVELMKKIGVGERLKQQGLEHHGFDLRFNKRKHRIDLSDLTDGKTITVYAQHEVIKDLVQARVETGRPLIFEAENVRPENFAEGESPKIHWTGKDGEDFELSCDFIAGCDGFHGVSRQAFPKDVLKIYEKIYPFGWLGILAESPPPSHELIYANHDRGFALFSMRSERITRAYLQCKPDENLSEWSDDRIWDELRMRSEAEDQETLQIGKIIDKGVTPMRSFVAEPMRYGKLFLAGDAAHIVPPTGAKGLNAAVADVKILSEAFDAFYKQNRTDLFDSYSDTALRRIWKIERFSWWMTSMLHKFDGNDEFQRRIQLAELDYIVSSRAGSTTLAENYVGLPFSN